MNYTERYHLPQWEETDRIMRTDFNQMCVDMEAGLSKTASRKLEHTSRISASVSSGAARRARASSSHSSTPARWASKRILLHGPSGPG